jgi:asparagine synthase (glutamine-hydrolysing)
MLLYFDKMSMATSLEVRVPFLDHEFVELCTSLPDSRKVWRTRRKELLKRASRGLVDDEIIDKKKRGFFHAALGSWMQVHRESMFESVLLDGRTRERGFYRPEILPDLIGAAGEDGKKSDQRLFCLLLLELWQRLFVDPGSRGRELARPAQSVGA